jgi:hypothetical protein
MNWTRSVPEKGECIKEFIEETLLIECKTKKKE